MAPPLLFPVAVIVLPEIEMVVDEVEPDGQLVV
jgi:hypothetical protein